MMRDQDGHVVKKGQVIFRIEPDERVSTESPESVAARRRETTLALLG
jgi:multidrug efflux pump subunit AcrA (membrane-fusion protein)